MLKRKTGITDRPGRTWLRQDRQLLTDVNEETLWQNRQRCSDDRIMDYGTEEEDNEIS